MGWQTDPRRICRTMDPEVFNDDTPGRRPAEAKVACRKCPVRSECLTYALDSNEPWGVWGGFTTAERWRILHGWPVKKCWNCGMEFVGTPNRPCDWCTFDPNANSLKQRVLLEETFLRQCVLDRIPDPTIAELLTDKLGVPVPITLVRKARMTLGLRCRTNGHHNKVRTYLVANVDDAEHRRIAFGRLSGPEQHELMRRWMTRAKATPTGFSNRYALSGARAVKLWNAVEATLTVERSS